LSYVTLAGGYIARPLGAVVFGHFGDRLGRKKMLVVTMVLMGLSSIGIGLIPGSGSIGVVAPVILVFFRLLQGFAVGGEWAGASLMSIEHARKERQGFAGAIVQSGGPSGAVLATLTFSLLSMLPTEQLVAWGWRVPFLASAIVVVAAIIIRLGVKESPEFEAVDATRGKTRIPLFSTFGENWRSVLLIVLTALSPFFLQSVTTTFGLQLAIANGNDQAGALSMLSVANFLTIFATLFFASLSDRFGRIRMMSVGFVVSGILIWFAFALLGFSSLWAILAAFVILMPIGNAMITGPLAAYMAELFPVRNRFTGVGISYQLAATISAGFAPLVATALVGAASGSTVLLTSLISALAVLGLIAVVLSRRIATAVSATDQVQVSARHRT
jgi:MFS family permease